MYTKTPRTVSYKGREMSIASLAKETGIARTTLSRRIHQLGWSVEEAVAVVKPPAGADAHGQAYRARITLHSKQVHLGNFPSKDTAEAAYRVARALKAQGVLEGFLAEGGSLHDLLSIEQEG